MQEGTQIEIYEERSIDKTKSYILEIPIGKMFIGRYDCIHAGVGYKTDSNTRLHIYLFPHEQNRNIWKKHDTVYFINNNIKCDNLRVYTTTCKHQQEVYAYHATIIAEKVRDKKRKRHQQTANAVAARMKKINYFN